MKTEQTECSETLTYKIQMPGNYPEENIQNFLLVSLWLYLPQWLQYSFLAKSNHCCKATHSRLNLFSCSEIHTHTHTHTHTHKLKIREVLIDFRFCVPRNVWSGRLRNLVLYVNTSNIKFYHCVTLVLIIGLTLWVIHAYSLVNKVAQDHNLIS